MDTGNDKPKNSSGVHADRLAFVVGAVVGFAVGYLWSNAQVPVMPSGQAIRGEHRGMFVLGHAFLGAIAGGLGAAAIALIVGRFRKNDKTDTPD